MEITIYALITITLLYAILMLYYVNGWQRVKYYIPTYISAQTTTMVTVIIPARNEEGTITACLTDILAQHYPQQLLQIIVVDDNSTDNTAQCVRLLQKSHKSIELLELKDNTGNAFKKRAITNAIAIAEGELIVSTDADCRMKPNWLPLLVSYYQTHKPIMIAAPVCFDGEKTMFERMQTLEFLGLIGIGAASIGNKAPTMCNGANLAYRKDAFLEVGGFLSANELASGDDAFLMFKIAERYKGGVHFLKNIQATVYTNAKPNLAEFVSQRKRWASKSTAYNNTWVKAVAILVYAVNVAVLASLVLTIVDVKFIILFVFIISVKSVVDLLFLMPVLSFFRRTNLLWLFVPEQLLYTFYVVIIGAIAPFGKYNWKGRMVK